MSLEDLFKWEPETIWDKIVYKYYDIVPYNWRPKNIWYYIKCKLFKKYNTVKCKSLPPTWVDRDHLLFHCNFQILCDFIDQEKPFEHFDFNQDAEHVRVKNELEDLYNWYNKCITSKDVSRTYFDLDFEECSQILEKHIEKEEKSKSTEPIYDNNHKIIAWKLNHEFHDEQKWRQYVKALSKLETMHDEFLNQQIIRIIKLRRWMWT